MTKPVFYLLLALGTALTVVGLWTLAAAGHTVFGWCASTAGIALLVAPAVAPGRAREGRL